MISENKIELQTLPDFKKVQENTGSRNDLGVVQRRTDTSMNIKYRTPPRKISKNLVTCSLDTTAKAYSRKGQINKLNFSVIYKTLAFKKMLLR